MRTSLLRRLLVAGLFFLASSSVSAQSFDTLLQRADRVRTSDTTQFKQILAQLQKSAAGATPVQRQQLRLLHAYLPLLAGDYQTSIRELKNLLAENPGIDLRYRADAILANNYALTREFLEGLSVMERTLGLAEFVKDAGVRQQGLLVAAILYDQVGQYELGLHYAQQILAEHASERSRCIAGGLRIEALQHLQAAPSDEAILSAIQLCKSQNERIPSGLITSYLARKWYAEGKLDSAIQLLNENIVEVEATHYPRAVGEVYSLWAELLFAKGDLAGAEQKANSAIAQKVGIARTPPLVMAYKTLYQIAERRQDIVKALSYYKQYSEADSAYLDEVKARELAYQIVRAENQQKNQQIELLNRRNNVLQLQQQVDRQAAENSRLMMMFLGLVALSITYWAYKTRRLHASLRRMAETDALTEVCNRHHFTQQAEECLETCEASGEQAALIMFDLDHFKAINDSYGHVTGDWVLKAVASTCITLCRKMDKVGRLGGEEFAVLIHGSDLKSATRIAEDCRVRLSQIDSRPSGYTFPITASFGVSSTAMSGYDLDKLLSHADQMLYRAKREGRNRVRTYMPDFPIEMTEPHAHDDSSSIFEDPMSTSVGAFNA